MECPGIERRTHETKPRAACIRTSHPSATCTAILLAKALERVLSTSYPYTDFLTDCEEEEKQSPVIRGQLHPLLTSAEGWSSTP